MRNPEFGEKDPPFDCGYLSPEFPVNEVCNSSQESPTDNAYDEIPIGKICFDFGMGGYGDSDESAMASHTTFPNP